MSRLQTERVNVCCSSGPSAVLCYGGRWLSSPFTPSLPTDSGDRA